MGKRGMRRAALLVLLVCAMILPAPALADNPVAFSDWLKGFETQPAQQSAGEPFFMETPAEEATDGEAPAEPEAAPEAVVEPENAPEEIAEPEAVLEEAPAEPEAISEEAPAEPEAAPEAVVEPENAPEEIVEPEAVLEEAPAEPEAVPAEAVAEPEIPLEEAVAEPGAVWEEAPVEPEAGSDVTGSGPVTFSDWLKAFGAPEAPIQEPVPSDVAPVEPQPVKEPAPSEPPAAGTDLDESGLPRAVALPMEDAFERAPVLDPPEPLKSARIRAVGDLMVHKKQLDVAKQSDGSYDFHSQYALIADSLGDADYTLANLETTVGKYRDMDYSGFPMFNSPASLLETVKDAGVDFLTLANNHMLDRYFEGMVNTVNLVEQYGFDFGGANRTPEERDLPRIVEVNGIRLGILCYTQMTNGMEAYCRPDAEEYGINYLRKADFAADVQKLRDAGADVVIALPHWGEEYRRKPEANTVALAKLLVASGVDVILGSHPHMVQPVTFVEAETESGETRRGLVAYSLGNFISNMTTQYTDSGIILDFTIQQRQDGSYGIDDVRCVPIYCWRTLDGVQPISSLKYLTQKPEIMDSVTFARMQQSYWELRELLDDDIEMLQD